MREKDRPWDSPCLFRMAVVVTCKHETGLRHGYFPQLASLGPEAV